jgi:hypothetical protein
LCHNNGTSAKSVNAAAANGYWQADFNYPTNEDGMKIVAKMTVNTMEYKAEVTDISILHNPGGLTIESDGVTLDAAGKLVDKKAQPNGKIGDDVLKVVSVYFVNGMLLGDADPKKMNTDTDGKTWKSDHTFKDGTNETGVSLVVTGFAWDNGKARLVSCSKTNLTVKA